MATGDDLLVFLYDDKGTPYGVFTLIDGVQEHLFYLYNAQGDVIAIIDDYAERVVNYEYGAWGELLSVTGSKADTVGVLNPFRYRGYCYDTETGLYYLNSRYYDPITQRFVNADSYVTTGQGILAMNMFSYCGNSPILRTDPSGGFWITTFFIATLVIATVAVVSEIGYKHLEKSNYRHNSRVDNNKSTTTRNKIINDQNGTTGKNFNYGVRKAEKNGCEPIALHNAKVLTGKESTLSDTMKSFSEARQWSRLAFSARIPLAYPLYWKEKEYPTVWSEIPTICQSVVYI